MLPILLLFALGPSVPKVSMVPLKTLDPVPEDAEYFLQSPADVAVDEQGRYLVLDLSANTIFAWDKDGSFLGHFGKMGQGPGEFNFRANVGGPQGYVSTLGQDIYVYAGGNKTLSIFGAEFEFKSVRPFQITSGRTERFRAVEKDVFLIFSSSYFSDTPSRTVGTYRKDGSLIKEFQTVEDQTWYYDSENGQRRVVLRPYAPSMFMGYNESKQTVIVGDTSKSAFDLMSPQGKLLQTVAFPLPPKDLTKEDKEEYLEQSWFKNQNFFRVDFPDKKAVYNNVVPLSDGGYLVFLQSILYRTADGIYIDEKGAARGKLKMTCGERGGIYGSRERLIAITLDEDDEFVIQEMAVNLSGSRAAANP